MRRDVADMLGGTGPPGGNLLVDESLRFLGGGLRTGDRNGNSGLFFLLAIDSRSCSAGRRAVSISVGTEVVATRDVDLDTGLVTDDLEGSAFGTYNCGNDRGRGVYNQGNLSTSEALHSLIYVTVKRTTGLRAASRAFFALSNSLSDSALRKKVVWRDFWFVEASSLILY